MNAERSESRRPESTPDGRTGRLEIEAIQVACPFRLLCSRIQLAGRDRITMKAFERLPTLVLAPTASIRFHENPERQRTLRLVQRLRDDKFLRNPPIVASVRDGEYVLLDGANRVSAFRELGLSHVPVQVVDYGDPNVLLRGWHHLLLEGRSLDLHQTYGSIPGVTLRRIDGANLANELELRRLFAVLVDAGTTCWGLAPTGGSGPVDLIGWMRILAPVVAAYEGRTHLERIKLVDYANLPDVFRSREHQLVLYPALTKVELLQLVDAGVMIPTGISRHSIPGRALGLNVDLSFLTDLDSDAAKEQFLRDHVDALELRGRIRFYEESSFIMNE